MSAFLSAAPLDALRRGLVIPACPLALDARRTLDERRQRALLRYYTAAGAGGVAVAVHTTQFAIRDAKVGLFEPVLRIALEELEAADARHGRRHVRVGGICGQTAQALREAELLRRLGYDAGLLSLAAMKNATDEVLVKHAREVAGIFPVIGFYLQPAVGGRILSHSFWRRFLEIENVVAIKAAPFNRYQTLDVLRAVAESGRTDVALYTGNDDHIVLDLLSSSPFFQIAAHTSSHESLALEVTGREPPGFVGGLLGHWAVWTKCAVYLHARCRALVLAGGEIPGEMLWIASQVTDMNAAIFDSANGFRGCIAGVHEVLRRQGILEGIWCLDEAEGLSPGQAAEIDRVCAAYPHLVDDDFVKEHLEAWLQ